MPKARDIRHFVHPQTIVYTKRGPKYVKDVTLADHVYTKADNFVRVKQVLKQEYVGRLVNVDGRGYVGESHELLVIEGSEIFFKPAIEVKINDKLLSISPTECEDIPELTEDDCMMYGVMFSAAEYEDDGTASMSDNKLLIFAADYLKKNGLLISFSKENFSIKFKLPFNRATLVDEKGNKIIFKDLLNLPREKCEAVRDGVWHAKNADMAIANKLIAHSMRFMWLKTGTAMIFRVTTAVARGTARSRCTSNLGTPISSTSSTSRRTMETKKDVHETCSTRSGYPTCSTSGCRRTANGV